MHPRTTDAIQTGPPGQSLTQQAECTIQMFKAHIILILAGINDKFPISLWCHLLEPTKLTLNLLCQSKVAPKISAYAHIHGPHNYMKKPFAPLGCAIQAHVKPEDRHTWDTQSDAGFSLSMSIEHQWCFRVYVIKTRGHRSVTLYFSNNNTSRIQPSPWNPTWLQRRSN
jgi:hypothetical protein